MANKTMTPQNMDIYQTLFEQSADPILILENGLFTDCNQSAEQVLHAHKADFLPISPALISPEYQPDGRLSTEKAAEMIGIAIEKGSNRFEWVHRRLNGEDFQVELTLTSVKIGERQLIYTVWRDITERKRVDDAVKASQQKLALLIDSSPLAVIEWNTNFEVVSWNPAAERIFGYSFEEAKGRHAAGLIVPAEYKAAVDEVWANLLNQSGGTRSTNGNVTKDGRAITCEWYNTPLAGADGKVFGVSSLVEDVTERKLAEDAIKESQQKLSLLIDSSPLAVIEWNTNFEVVSWNPAAERIFGYSFEEAKGRHAAGLIVPAEYKAAVDEVWANLLNQSGGTRSTNGNVTKDGRAITCEWYNTPLAGPDGQVFGVSSLVEDVTERKQSQEKIAQTEKRFQALIENAPDGIAMAGPDSKYKYVSPSALKMLDLEAEDILGTDATDPIHSDDIPAVLEIIEKIVMDASFKPSMQYRIRHKDGSWLWIESTFTNLLAEPSVEAIVTNFRDITENKRLEQEAREVFERRGYQVQVSTEISQEVAAASELSDLFARVVTLTKERLGYYHTQLLRYDSSQDAVALVNGYGETGQKMLALGHQMPMGSGLIGTAAESGQTIMRPTLAEDFDWQPNPLLPDTKGEIAVPIKLGNQVLGVLDIQSDQAGSLTDDDRLLLEGLCGQIAVAIEQTRLRQEMTERLEEISRLYQTMSREGWKTYRENAELPAGFVFDQTGVRPVNDDVLAEDRFTNIPVKVLGGEVVGSLAIFDDPHHPTAPEDYEFLQQVSDQIALALEGARLSSQTQSALAQSEKLFEASRLLTQSTDLQELVKSSVEILNIPVVNRASLGIFNYNADGELESMTDIANWWNGTGHEVAAIGTSYSAKTLKLVSAFLSATPVFFNDTFNDERMGEGELQIIKRLNIRAIAVLPLYLGARQIGVLRLQAEEPHNFSQEETRLYAALAPQVATVVENRRQYQEAQSKAERESMLNVISQKIQSATTVEAVLQIAARELGHALGAPMTVAQLSMKDKQ